MPLKKRAKVTAEFNMSSLTDIIFLLLIFFMLTSNIVQIKPFDLPISESQTVAPTNIVVQLEQNGETSVNNVTVSGAAINQAVSDALAQVDNQEKATVTIVAEVGVPFSRISPLMQLAASKKARAIIATQPKG